VNLDTYNEPEDLYRARADEVNPNRPLFTGDVFRDVPIPGTQDHGMALILAHPCSFRMGAGKLADRILVAAVRGISKQGRNAWCVEHLLGSCRLACLSEFGVNMLQQRLTCHLTRAEVPTHQFGQAFSHTYEEADLLEDWTDTLTEAGWAPADAASAFEAFIRSGDPSYQEKLLDPQHRSAVRRACMQEAKRSAGKPVTASTR
jgi:hypothetical protein